MLKRLLFPLVFIAWPYIHTEAQQIDSGLNIYAKQFPPEKLHLHFDRGIYSREETVFYKAYLLEDHDLSARSKNLYVDYYDDDGKLILQTTASLFQSSAKGSFTIPADYTGNALHIKAYTKWMLNFDTSFIYNRTLRIYQPAAEKPRKPKIPEKSFPPCMVQLYPEGGFAVEGLANRFAFAAVNQFGNPVSIKGIIKASNGKILDSVTAIHDGMGIFFLWPQKGLSYSFEWRDEKGNTAVLPIVIEKRSGANIRIEQHDKKALFTVQRTADAGALFKTMHLLVHRNQMLRYRFDINMSEKTRINFDIATDDLYTGIVQFTLFNDDWIPVAERIIFVNNKNHFFQPEVNVIKKDMGKKGKNELEISVPDTLFANMSVAVIDAGTNIDEPTIFSDFLLTDEIKGKVNNPGYYFQSSLQDDGARVATHLDLVMLTHGYRRFDWEKIAKGELPVIAYPAETDYIGIKGKLNSKKLQNSKDQLLLNVMLEGKDSVKTMYTIPVEKGGVFEKKNIFYYDTVKIFYGLAGRRTFAAEEVAEFGNRLLTADEKRKFFAGHGLIKKIGSIPGETAYDFFEEQEKIKKLTSYKTLKEVIVSTRVKTKLQILDNFYTSGVFTGDDNNYKVDVEGDVAARGYQNIFDYLQSKLPGLTVTHSGMDISVTWFRSFEVIGSENGPAFFLNEVPVSLEAILSIPVADIAYVKGFRPPFVGSFLNGITGTIVVYTRKGNNPLYQDTSGEGLAHAILQGYTKFKEFTQPDYDNSKTNTEADYRATLYWNPYILTDKDTPRLSIPFYNNDISKKLVVILEGVNLEGKMARVVKVLE